MTLQKKILHVFHRTTQVLKVFIVDKDFRHLLGSLKTNFYSYHNTIDQKGNTLAHAM